MTSTRITTLNDLVDAGVIQLTRGKVISRKDIAACPGDFPVYSSARENDGKFGEYGRYMFDEELITWSVDGGGRLFHRPRHKFSVTNVGGILRILDKGVLDCRYLYYALTLRHSEVRFDWVKKAHPSVIKKLYRDIPIPTRPEQRRIIGVLDETFARVAIAKANAETNIKNSRALFESHLQSVFTQRGEGWVEKTIGDIAQVKGGKRVPKGYKLLVEPTRFPYLRVADFSDSGSIEMSDLRYVSDEVHQKIKSYVIASADLYISIAGTIGKAGIVPPELDGAHLTENACRLVFGPGVSNRFVYYFTCTRDFVEQAGLNTRTAAQPKLALSRLSTIRLGIPPFEVQKLLADRFDELHMETQRLARLFEQKLSALTALERSLLRQAFSGNL